MPPRMCRRCRAGLEPRHCRSRSRARSRRACKRPVEETEEAREKRLTGSPIYLLLLLKKFFEPLIRFRTPALTEPEDSLLANFDIGIVGCDVAKNRHRLRLTRLTQRIHHLLAGLRAIHAVLVDVLE